MFGGGKFMFTFGGGKPGGGNGMPPGIGPFGDWEGGKGGGNGIPRPMFGARHTISDRRLDMGAYLRGKPPGGGPPGNGGIPPIGPGGGMPKGGCPMPGPGGPVLNICGPC
jgi:hypothetical protein